MDVPKIPAPGGKARSACTDANLLEWCWIWEDDDTRSLVLDLVARDFRFYSTEARTLLNQEGIYKVTIVSIYQPDDITEEKMLSIADAFARWKKEGSRLTFIDYSLEPESDEPMEWDAWVFIAEVGNYPIAVPGPGVESFTKFPD